MVSSNVASRKSVEMTNDRGYCISCTDDLCHLDDDPNGSRNATCARCRAEEEHDYDVEPHAVFSRSGERIDNVPPRRVLPDEYRKLLEQIPQQSQRQDSAKTQLEDLHAFANRLGLYKAADAIKTIFNATKG